LALAFLSTRDAYADRSNWKLISFI